MFKVDAYLYFDVQSRWSSLRCIEFQMLTAWISIPLVKKSVPSRKNTKLRNLTINQFEISAVTESVTDHRSHDGPSCMFVMKIREVAEETCKYGMTESMTARHDHDGWPRRPVMTTTARHDHNGPCSMIEFTKGNHKVSTKWVYN